MFLLFLFALFLGGLIPIQTSVNSQLRQKVHSPILASFVNASIGVIALVLFNLIGGFGVHLPPDFWETTPWWAFIGGPLGAVIVITAILLMPYLGGLRTVLIVMVGSISAGFVIDEFGLFRVPVDHFDHYKFFGLIMVITGVIFILKLWRLLPRHKQAADTAIPSPAHARDQTSTRDQTHTQAAASSEEKSQPGVMLYLLLYLMGFISGASLSVQSSVNSVLAHTIDSTSQTAALSMTVTSSIFCLIGLVTRQRFSLVFNRETIKNPVILTGGLCGASSLMGCAWLVPHLGIGALSVLTISGQLISGLIIDHFGLLGSSVKKATWTQLLGVVITITGVVLIKYI